jgi:hypothetical protein
MTTLVKGDEECVSTGTDLDTAVRDFDETLSHFTSGVVFQTYETVRGMNSMYLPISYRLLGIEQDLASMRIGQAQTVETLPTQDEKFIVPYKRNLYFRGRENLIATLCTKLSQIMPDSMNHQMMLYGLGGMGKTQLALEYVYSHRENYERIYWINVTSEAALFSGFQDIAKRTSCPSANVDDKPSETAKLVLDWLDGQESWLVVFDNLDDVDVITNYLPNPSPHRHILITTRNKHCEHIPAEGLKLRELAVDDAADFLIARSKIGIVGQTPEGRKEAVQVVIEVGCLPLAIEQAAAYIREALTNIFDYLPIYSTNRKRLLARISKGNRTYYERSVATTWQMSFSQIEKNNIDASILVKLLAFMNPDGILTDFLDAGKDGLEGELQEVLSDHYRFLKANWNDFQ